MENRCCIIKVPRKKEVGIVELPQIQVGLSFCQLFSASSRMVITDAGRNLRLTQPGDLTLMVAKI
jgi:hypothetical protein